MFFRRGAWVLVVLCHVHDDVVRNPFFGNSLAIAFQANAIIMEFQQDQRVVVELPKMATEEETELIVEHGGIEDDGDIRILLNHLGGFLDHIAIDQHHVPVGRKFVVASVKLFAGIVGSQNHHLFIGVLGGVFLGPGGFSDSGRSADEDELLHARTLYYKNTPACTRTFRTGLSSFLFLRYNPSMSKAKRPSKAMEDFLEALLMLQEEGKPLETTLVAEILGVSKPAVHQMGHELIDRGLITRKDYGDMKLTAEGKAVAEKVLHRHRVLKEYLLALGVSEEVAEIDCCKMEHDLEDETFEAIEADLRKRK